MNTEEEEIKLMEFEFNSKFYEDMLSKVYIDPSEEIKHPPVAISMGYKQYYSKDGVESYPVPIGTYGNFIFIQAPPKSCKSFFISLLSTVFLNDHAGNRGGSEGFSLQGHRGNREMVHVDTEQGHFHASRVFRRPYQMTGKGHEGYHTLALRELSPKDRLGFIEWYLDNKTKDCGFLVIDGIADLCNDVNNIEESNLLTQKIMELSVKHNCLIATVIHSNFGSEKPTGHLGSFLEKKAETQISLEKESTTQEDTFINVKCKRSRNTPFKPFRFSIDKYGLPKVEKIASEVLNGVIN